MCKKKLLLAVGLLAALACADATGPPVYNPLDDPLDDFVALARVDGQAGGSVENHILEQALSSPALETYKLEFWAVRGRARYVQIRYQGEKVVNDDDDPGGDGSFDSHVAGDIFLALYIPRNALSRHPDGTRIRRGERVEITITVHPTDLYVSFEPSGLVFNRRGRPRLYLSYNGADPDFDDDGDVDGVDTYIEENHLKLWHFDPPSSVSMGEGAYASSAAASSSSGDSRQSKKSKSIVGKIRKLSDHAVSW
jgi:hypothetical protein